MRAVCDVSTGAKPLAGLELPANGGKLKCVYKTADIIVIFAI